MRVLYSPLCVGPETAVNGGQVCEMANTTCPQCGAALSAEWATPAGEVWCRACRAQVPLDAAGTEDARHGIDWTRALRPSSKKTAARQPEDTSNNQATAADQASPEQPPAQDAQPSPETPEAPESVPDRARWRFLRWLFPESPRTVAVLPDTVPETEPDSPRTPDGARQDDYPDTQTPVSMDHNAVAGRLLADLTQARARAVWQDRALDEVRARCEALAGVIGKLTDDLHHERAECARLEDALQEALLDAEKAREEAARRDGTRQTDTALAVRPEVLDHEKPGSRDELLEALMRFTSGRNSGGR